RHTRRGLVLLGADVIGQDDRVTADLAGIDRLKIARSIKDSDRSQIDDFWVCGDIAILPRLFVQYEPQRNAMTQRERLDQMRGNVRSPAPIGSCEVHRIHTCDLYGVRLERMQCAWAKCLQVLQGSNPKEVRRLA